MNAHLECPRCGEQAMTFFRKAARGPNRSYPCAHCGGSVAIHRPAFYWAAYPLLLLVAFAIKAAAVRFVFIAVVGLALAAVFTAMGRIVLHNDPITFDS